MRPVGELVADEIAIYREEFGMILDDLRALPADRPILAEGAVLLPEFVIPVMSDPRAAVWVVPTPDFQLKQYHQRPWIQGILKKCRDPDQAFRNWMDWRSEDFGKPSYLKKLGLTLAHNDKGEPTRRIHALDAKERTIGEALQEAGYFTALIGKWHSLP